MSLLRPSEGKWTVKVLCIDVKGSVQVKVSVEMKGKSASGVKETVKPRWSIEVSLKEIDSKNIVTLDVTSASKESVALKISVKVNGRVEVKSKREIGEG